MTRDKLIAMVDVYAETRLEAADPECSTRYAAAKVARDATIDAVDALFRRIAQMEEALVAADAMRLAVSCVGTARAVEHSAYAFDAARERTVKP